MVSNNLISYRFSSAKRRQMNIFKAAEEFNDQFKIKHWIVHYDVSLNRDVISIKALSL